MQLKLSKSYSCLKHSKKNLEEKMIIVFAIIPGIFCVFLFKSAYPVDTYKDWAKIIAASLLLAATLVGVLFGLCIPFGGYEEPELVESYEVVSFILDDKAIYAVDGNDECTVFVRVNGITDEGEIALPKLMELEGAYEIVPEEECKMPRVEEYLKRGKGSIWSFAKLEDQILYRIYVPAGTVYSSDE
jgi:hypothetical protein